VRNDPSLVRFTGITHEPVRAVGPGRFLDASLYHADLLRPVAERSQKGRRYESDRPGLRIAGRALNQAYYLPELRESLRTARVPAEDLRLIERIHGAPEPESSDAATFPLASREEIDAHWPARVGAETDFDGEVVLRRGPSRMVAGGREIYEIQVRNSGTRMWQWGLDGIPPIRIAYRWFAPDGSVVVPDGFRTGLPADLGPGETHIVPVHVEAPIHEGPLILELNLVHEGVRWFERPSRQTVEVVPPRCVGIVFASDAGSAIQVAQAVVAEAPELEPLLLSDETDLPYRTAHDINAADVVALIVAEQFEGLDGKLRAARAANIPVLFPDQGIDELIAALHALEQPGVAAAPAGTDSEDDGGRE
jgi:hypothetical protein